MNCRAERPKRRRFPVQHVLLSGRVPPRLGRFRRVLLVLVRRRVERLLHDDLSHLSHHRIDLFIQSLVSRRRVRELQTQFQRSRYRLEVLDRGHRHALAQDDARPRLSQRARIERAVRHEHASGDDPGRARVASHDRLIDVRGDDDEFTVIVVLETHPERSRIGDGDDVLTLLRPPRAQQVVVLSEKSRHEDVKRESSSRASQRNERKRFHLRGRASQHLISRETRARGAEDGADAAERGQNSTRRRAHRPERIQRRQHRRRGESTGHKERRTTDRGRRAHFRRAPPRPRMFL